MRYEIRNANGDVEIADVGHWLSNVCYDRHNERYPQMKRLITISMNCFD